MDISTGLGLLAGGIVLCTLILMGGDLRMFVDLHAFIVIFGGSFSATLIRFPLASIFHGLPLGAKFAFTMRRTVSSGRVLARPTCTPCAFLTAIASFVRCPINRRSH